MPQNGVDVYLAGLRKTDDIYETSKQIYEHGAEPIYSVSVPAAVSKLRAAYNSSLKNIDTLISMIFITNHYRRKKNETLPFVKRLS